MTAPKTLSDRQLAANRANALRSTGPRTPAGRARSRWNALKHGALAEALIPPALEQYESRAAFDELLASLHASLAPDSPVEEMLVERIAVSYWRLARLLRTEAGSIAYNREMMRFMQRQAAEHQEFDDARAVCPAEQELLEELEPLLGEPALLRAVMVKRDPLLAQGDDAAVLAAASTLVQAARRSLAARQAVLDAIEQDTLRAPDMKQALQYARYEASLERQFYRALNTLERLQRLRGGEFVPPPLELRVDGTLEGTSFDRE